MVSRLVADPRFEPPVVMGVFEHRSRYWPGVTAPERHSASLPDNEVPCVVAMEPATLAQTQDTSIAITHLSVYRSGIAFTLTVRVRRLDGLDMSGANLSCVVAPTNRGDPHKPVAAQVLRLGVRFADGRVATNLDEWPPARQRTQHGPMLTSHLRRGGRGRYQVQQWLEPLPPPGPLTFACEWPVRGIGESNLVVDGERVRDATAETIVLWPTST